MIFAEGLVISSPPLDPARPEIGFRTWIRPGGDVYTKISTEVLALDAAAFRVALDAHRARVATVVGRRRKLLTGVTTLLRGGVGGGGFLGFGDAIDLEVLEATSIYALKLAAMVVIVIVLDLVGRRLIALALRRVLGT